MRPPSSPRPMEMLGGQVDEAFSRLLGVIRKGPGEDRNVARVRLLELFETLGNTDPRVLQARRDLMTALFEPRAPRSRGRRTACGLCWCGMTNNGNRIMYVKRLIPALLAAGVLALGGCTAGSPDQPAPSPSEAGTTAPSAVSPSPEASTSPAASTDSVASCLNGRYELGRFVGEGDKGTFGTGFGGDLSVTFDDGSYVMEAAGQRPYTLSLLGQSAELVVDGTIEGDYTVNGNQVTFRRGDTSGEATLTIAGRKQSLTMAQVANVLAPEGTANLACSGENRILTLDRLRLEFLRR